MTSMKRLGRQMKNLKNGGRIVAEAGELLSCVEFPRTVSKDTTSTQARSLRSQKMNKMILIGILGSWVERLSLSVVQRYSSQEDWRHQRSLAALVA